MKESTSKGLSIQITLGGFSFHAESSFGRIDGELSSYDFDAVLSAHYHLPCAIEWSVPNVLIVPFEIFDHSCIDHYLIDAGMLPLGKGRSMFAVRAHYVAVWAVDEALAEYIDSRVAQAEHNHALLELLDQYNSSIDTIALTMDSTGLMHIAVWGSSGLDVALSAQVTSAVDALFFCRRLAKNDELISYKVLCGDGVGKEIISLLKGYYSRVESLSDLRCE